MGVSRSTSVSYRRSPQRAEGRSRACSRAPCSGPHPVEREVRGIRLVIRDSGVVLQAHNPEQEEAEEELEVEYAGDEIEIGFNVNYLLDALGAWKVRCDAVGSGQQPVA